MFCFESAMKDAALADVINSNAHEFVFGDAPSLFHNAARLTQFHAINCVAHASCIRKVRLTHPKRQVFRESLS